MADQRRNFATPVASREPSPARRPVQERAPTPIRPGSRSNSPSRHINKLDTKNIVPELKLELDVSGKKMLAMLDTGACGMFMDVEAFEREFEAEHDLLVDDTPVYGMGGVAKLKGITGFEYGYTDKNGDRQLVVLPTRVVHNLGNQLIIG